MMIEEFRVRLRVAADEALRHGFCNTHQALLELLVSVDCEAQQTASTGSKNSFADRSTHSELEFRLH